MPMALYLGSSLSADSFTIAISIFTIALFFKFGFDPEIKEIKYKDISILMFLIIIIGLTKQIYLFLLLLFFLIPSNKFGTRKKMLSSFILILVPSILITGIWTFFNSGFYIPLLEGVSVTGQISHVLSNPTAFFQAFFNAISQYKLKYLGTFVGNFGWLKPPFHTFWSICSLWS
jgi:uncharacterized membrane protein